MRWGLLPDWSSDPRKANMKINELTSTSEVEVMPRWKYGRRWKHGDKGRPCGK